jgi:hypothetical protein
MAKKKKTRRASGVAVAMRKRFATQNTTHKRKGMRRRNSKSWEKDEEKAYGE